MRRTITLATLLLVGSLGPAAAERLVTPSADVETNVVIRRAPSTASEALGALQPGDSAKWLGELVGWYRIAHDDPDHAFVSKDWTETTGSAGEATVSGPSYEVYVVDVGTGLAVYAHGPDFSLVYDAGTQDDFGGGTNRLLSLLDDLGVAGEPIDHLVLNHPHRDHLLLLPGLLGAVEVREIWETGCVYESCFYE